MALNLPDSPTTGEIHLATNGINYQWDGSKWEVYVVPSSGANQWERDTVNNALNPINNGDDIVAKDSGDVTTITLDAETETSPVIVLVQANGFDLDNLTTLPDKSWHPSIK